MPPGKSPKSKPTATPRSNARQQKTKGGCLRRVGLPLALLFGGCLVLSVIVSAIQNVGERVGLLPTSTPPPTPTFTLTPSVTPAATDTPVPSATPTVTVTPLATATHVPTDTPAPMPTATPAPTDTAALPNTPTAAPTGTPPPTSTPTPAPISQRSEQIALPLDSAPVTSKDANLRSGPGQQYPVVGGTVTGQRLEGGLAPVAQSADGGWLALADGSWVAASLVAGAPSGLPVVSAPDAAAAADAAQAPEPAATAVPAAAQAAADSQPGAAGGSPWPEYTCEDNPSPPPDPACVIKGNITGEHIYHMPGQRDYCETVIDGSKGERWFCTTQEAEAAGWRAAQR